MNISVSIWVVEPVFMSLIISFISSGSAPISGQRVIAASAKSK